MAETRSAVPRRSMKYFGCSPRFETKAQRTGRPSRGDLRARVTQQVLEDDDAALHRRQLEEASGRGAARSRWRRCVRPERATGAAPGARPACQARRMPWPACPARRPRRRRSSPSCARSTGAAQAARRPRAVKTPGKPVGFVREWSGWPRGILDDASSGAEENSTSTPDEPLWRRHASNPASATAESAAEPPVAGGVIGKWRLRCPCELARACAFAIRGAAGRMRS